jgi:hypothetical protein
LRNIPLWAAEHLSSAAAANKIYVGVYILGIFFVTPLVLIGGCQLLGI